MIEDITTKSAIGMGGTLATIGLESVNELVSLAVGLATFVYMICSIIKLVKNKT